MIEIGISTMDVEEIMQKSEEEAEKQYIGTVKTADFDLPSKYDFKIQDTYTVDDFLQYYDIAFLENAYWGIMGRAPDETGMRENLKLLHNGMATRTDILTALRFSEEGETKGAKIYGLERPKEPDESRLYKIPLLGTLIRYIQIQIILHKRVTQLEKRLIQLEAELGKLHYQDSILRDVVNEKCDRSAAEYLRLRLKEKADKTELAHHGSKKDNRG